ncbi:MAG: recombinase RecQ [Flavobacteriaceae bacterium]|nr:recombinase RecQ [Flavobacteriaceae bacterium]|tara:strand:- start:3143 stop:4840 length:1698 start_codon:yes stop_codon:yes gene_type:complete
MLHPLQILKKYWGHTGFRLNQKKIIEAILENEDCLALLPTGGGKSICFQVPALIKEGICIVISPLIALMQDQVASLNQKGIKAMALTNVNHYSELERMLDNCIFGNYKFLYISPERLDNKLVQSRIKSMKVSLIAVDEAHCISQWGHDFRPAYRNIKILRILSPQTAVIALTATATKHVIEDIIRQLDFLNYKVFKSSFFRSNLSYNSMTLDDPQYKAISILKNIKSSAIVYVRSRIETEQLVKTYELEGISCGYYHGGMSLKKKELMYSNWIDNKFSVMIATNAFGMGIDKSNVEVVIHLTIPESLEAYFQESGRAGRNGDKAFAYLITSPGNVTNMKTRFENLLPNISFLKLIYKKLCINFQIGYGEYNNERQGLYFDNFCKIHKLSKHKTFNALKTLQSYGVLIFEMVLKNKLTIQFLISNNTLQSLFEKDTLEKNVINVILRTYEGIFVQPTTINIEKIANKTELKTSTVLEVLERLKFMKVMEFKNSNADIQITFLVSREDEKTIHRISKPVLIQNKIKLKKLNAVFKYMENNSACKSLQLLNYFDEKVSIPCGICNVCN